MSKLVIPRKTVYRLSLYYRALQRLRVNKIETVSSAALAKAAGVKPTQLRKDLAKLRIIVASGWRPPVASYGL